VRSTDHGKYTCVRANEAGSISGSSHLSVMVRTQIVQPPVDSKVILGHIASLTCKVSADRNVPFQVRF
jgi:protein sidekick